MIKSDKKKLIPPELSALLEKIDKVFSNVIDYLQKKFEQLIKDYRMLRRDNLKILLDKIQSTICFEKQHLGWLRLHYEVSKLIYNFKRENKDEQIEALLYSVTKAKYRDADPQPDNYLNSLSFYKQALKLYVNEVKTKKKSADFTKPVDYYISDNNGLDKLYRHLSHLKSKSHKPTKHKK